MDWGALAREASYRLEDLAEQFPWKFLWASLLSAASWVFSSFDATLMPLLALYALDFLLGLICAWRGKSFSSYRFRRGIYKFLLYLVVIAAATWTDQIMGVIPYLHHPIRTFFVAYLALGELLSVCAHASTLHPGIVPKGLLERVRDYRKNLSQGRDCQEVNRGS